MEFTNDQHEALVLAGTVALPSPYPASGQASFVLTDWDGESGLYIKLTQVMSPKQIVSRFVRPEDIQAIRSKPASGCDDPRTWPILSPRKTLQEVRNGETAIIAAAKAANVKFLEKLWHAAAILYVPEMAPVLHRHEVGLTAAASAEGNAVSFTNCCEYPKSIVPFGHCCG